MCIGIPMQVQSTLPGHALVAGPRGVETVNTALVGDCAPGQWLLVFLGSARERLSAERAAEIQAMLDWVEASLNGQYDPEAAMAQTHFALPSAMGAEQLAALLGSAVPESEFLTQSKEMTHES